jgi:HSP20 family protein
MGRHPVAPSPRIEPVLSGAGTQPKEETAMRLIPFNNSPAREVDSLFSTFFADSAQPAWAPRLDLRESADDVRVQVDLPGVRKEDISVTLEDGLLSISGKRQAEHQTEDAREGWLRVERAWGGFERHVRLGELADAERVKADYKDGVLTVTVPKKEAAKPRSIKID